MRKNTGAGTTDSTAVMCLVLAAIGVSLAGCATPAASEGPANGEASAAELEARGSYLASLADQFGIEAPDAHELIRLIDQSEWAATQVECLRSMGFDVAVMPDGEGIDPTAVPLAQAQRGGAYQAARFECESSYTVRMADGFGYTDSELGRLNDWYVETSVPCLESEGIVVASAPSRQQFIETYYTASGWIPYQSVDAVSMPEREWLELNQACPQDPAPLGLFD